MKICVVGSLNTDIVISTPTVPNRGETVFVEKLDILPGGRGTFAGALACALVDGKDIFEAARFACIVSALKVTKFGTQIGIPTLAELNEFIKENNLNEFLNSFTKHLR